MGLFLGPFSGHAVGGGGHGVIDPPPPGTDPNSGPRSEVDTVNRSPLRLLKTTMNKHKPKFMKIVPPGQQRGSLAPPYAWNPLERDDWRYNMRKPSKLGEADYTTDVLPPSQEFKSLSAPRNRPKKGDTRRLPRPNFAKPSAPKPAPSAPDPRQARIAAIHQEIKGLRAQVKQLLARQHELVQQGKQQMSKHAGQFGSTFKDKPQIESLSRTQLRIVEGGDYTPIGIPRRSGDAPRPGWHIDPHSTKLPMNSREQNLQIMHDRNLRSQGIPTGLTNQPQQSGQIIAIHKELAQKKARIDQLTQELHQLSQQAKAKLESIGLATNNLSRVNLLLK